MAGSSTDLFVTDAVTAFLDERGIGHGPVRHRPLGDGHSNLTYLVERDDVRVVLRRPPRPPLPPSAHDMVRESAIVGRLHAAGARVPEVLAVCEDPAPLGVPFYVMELAPGVPVDRELPPAIDRRPAGRGSATSSSTCWRRSTRSIPRRPAWRRSGGPRATSSGRCGGS